jgi:hypothetical protein
VRLFYDWLKRFVRIKGRYTAVFLLAAGFLFSPACRAENPQSHVSTCRDAILNILQSYGEQTLYDSYITYVNGLMDRTQGAGWWNDKNGLFRLRTIDRWLRSPLDCIVDGEFLTRQLHGLASSGISRVAPLLLRCAKLLDLNDNYGMKLSDLARINRCTGVLERLQMRLDIANSAVESAFSGFRAEELAEFRITAHQQMVAGMGDAMAHSLPDNGKGALLCSMAQRVNFNEIIRGAIALCGIFNDSEFDALRAQKSARHGQILIGTRGNDTYDLDRMTDVMCVIDPGGDDTYLGGSTTQARRILLIIDFDGNDRYFAPSGYAQGAGSFGISILYDRRGNDVYEGGDVCQGTGFIGVGILADEGGNDTYIGDRRAQGSSVCGIGLLLDREGNDRYSVALFGQGYGGMFGVGILEDSSGDDHYVAGGKYDEPYQEPPHYYKQAWSQGCGSGFRGTANGGFGIMLDGRGNDIYEADYFSTGGYWFAAGLARDFSGNDIRRPLTHDFSRYGFGYACHYAIGLLYDDTGNDTYLGTLGIQGFGWDIGTAGLFDFEGDDVYTATISGQGFAAQASWAILYDGSGSDRYQGGDPRNCQGIPDGLEYHPRHSVGGNFSFLLDYGKGADFFSSGVVSGAITRRSTENGAGYLVDIVKSSWTNKIKNTKK